MRSRCNNAASHFLALTQKELCTKADKHTHILKIHRYYGRSWNRCLFIFIHTETVRDSHRQTHSHIKINRSSHMKIHNEHVDSHTHILPHIGPFIQSYCGGERGVFHSSDVSNLDE